MSSEALRHLSMFLAAAIIIWACQTGCRFSYILQFARTVLYINTFYLFCFAFFSVLVRSQKWGMDLLGITRFFRQRAHILPLLHISCFCSPVNMMTRRKSRAAPTVPPAPRPQKRAVQATRESHKAKRSKSAALATVPNTDSRQSASELPSQLVTVPIAGNDAAPAPEDVTAIVSESFN